MDSWCGHQPQINFRSNTHRNRRTPALIAGVLRKTDSTAGGGWYFLGRVLLLDETAARLGGCLLCGADAAGNHLSGTDDSRQAADRSQLGADLELVDHFFDVGFLRFGLIGLCHGYSSLVG